MENMIERYRNKADDRNLKEFFIFNSKSIKPSQTVLETQLLEGSQIFVIEKGVIQ